MGWTLHRLAMLLAFLLLPAAVVTAEKPAWQQLDAARDWLGGEEPASGGLRIELPLVSEEGMSVPLEIRGGELGNSEAPIREIRVYALGNPDPDVLGLRLDPALGRADFSTRIRLDESQTVLVLARDASGRFLAAEQPVRVANSGCLARSDEPVDAPMGAPRVAVPDPFPGAGEPGEVRTLILHPMETGFREGPDGKPVARRIIEDFSAELDGETVLSARFHAAVSANPYLAFRLAPRADGELRLHWRDETGEEREAYREVRVGSGE
ncbi:thiosulfate oxidation carrier complex protein SoxZ [Methylonatrum kenyense]|uniref:thiosulfate oxidation carrier complex protein SoxZ n=1 Tax=Methylonatrum kenyense TaxID=455253 RepID=UPI0020BE0865|nr:thiosulfate oxidation carrier complex protein SoxZ [Methylonatrum kenyense]MCK8517254.1 thiosulfate oxidation carrier complex protein SoxZ [Methylonatrum kenyense]